jgi:hypothetical protein
MVLTDLLLHNNQQKVDIKLAKIFNILAEEASTVANWIVPCIRQHSDSRKGVQYLMFLTGIYMYLYVIICLSQCFIHSWRFNLQIPHCIQKAEQIFR